jgi:glycosyltransferase involved in cell wall biosynthesis
MKISIITINRNKADGLKQTLISVAEQTSTDFEHIVIDGASTDHSIDVIKHFSHIAYYISEPDAGVFDAMNKGIKQAKGEYCLFLNSGDYLASSTVIAAILPNLNNEHIIYGNLLKKSLTGEIKRNIYPDEITINRFVLASIPHPASFIKTSLLKQLGLYRTDLRIVSDWAFFLEAIFKHDACYKHIPIYITVFALGGMSTNPAFKKIEIEEREKVWKDLFPYTYKELFRLVEREQELNKVYQIPGVHFLMKYVHPLYKKLRYKE